MEKMNEKSIEIGRIIRNKRMTLNLQMEDVANKADITRATLWNIERGLGTYSFNNLLSVLEILQIDLHFVGDKVEYNTRTRASRTVTKVEQVVNRFLVMCVQQYSKEYGLNSKETYKQMLDSGLLKVLEDDYEDLHGMSTDYLSDFIDRYLEVNTK